MPSQTPPNSNTKEPLCLQQTRFWFEGIVQDSALQELIGRYVGAVSQSDTAAGLVAVATVSLLASLLVLSSVVSVSRRRQLYEANLLHCLGARHQAIRQSMLLETGLLTVLATGFATDLGR